ISPTHAPSLHSLRSFHAATLSAFAATLVGDATGSDDSSSTSSASDFELTRPGLRKSPKFGAGFPHILQVPSWPITPVHAPSSQSWRPSHLSTVTAGLRAPDRDRSRDRTSDRHRRGAAPRATG